MTEEEAKTKVCPQGAMRASFDGNWDRGYCIGSACMAWRSTPAQTFRPSSTEEELHYPEENWCGLAGAP